MQTLIAQVRATLLANTEVIAGLTEANTTITITGGSMTLDPATGFYNTSGSTEVRAWLRPDKTPEGETVPGIQPSDQYYCGRLIDPRELSITPRPGQVNACTIDEMVGEWVWFCADEGAFKFEDILGTPISGWFRRT